ncbi:thioesterase superfamily protein [Teratosphaeria destructans]|uniref:Thioesterase superfamily protein n=1 Tax=Teratosphaeria destructans TaxID=418781 RepID=A0A9W7W6M5_9PEZI|nr:thioesterase superfamily protein [Teratosphaeria destructans]
MSMPRKGDAKHPDFSPPWCQDILARQDIKHLSSIHKQHDGDNVTNAIFEKTLYSDQANAIRAHLSFRRTSNEPDAVDNIEECYLLSIGDGLDGKTGRAHGGFNALVLDNVAGGLAHHMNPDPRPPATAFLHTEYHAPISTPCVVLARAWATKVERRKYFVTAVIEDGQGKVLASSTSLFIAMRPPGASL